MSVARVWRWGGRRRLGISQFSVSGFALSAGRSTWSYLASAGLGYHVGWVYSRAGLVHQGDSRLGHWVLGPSIAGWQCGGQDQA